MAANKGRPRTDSIDSGTIANTGRPAPPTVASVMSTVDLHSELVRNMNTADLRFAQLTQESLPEHLREDTEVRGKKRKAATIETPRDRALLAAAPRSDDNAYVQLRRKTEDGMLVVGRSQNPSHLPPSERHLYTNGSRGAPSYPTEAHHLSAMSSTPQEAFQMVVDEMLAQKPIDATNTRDAANLATTANIIGIAEQRRDPFMGFASAQTIFQGSIGSFGDTLPKVFGHKAPGKKSGNVRGTMPASGTGAVAAFRGVRDSLTNGTPPPTASQPVLTDMENTQRNLMTASFPTAAVQRLTEEGASPQFVNDAALTQMRAGASRQAAKMVGQVQYNLRPLAKPDGQH